MGNAACNFCLGHTSIIAKGINGRGSFIFKGQTLVNKLKFTMLAMSMPPDMPPEPFPYTDILPSTQAKENVMATSKLKKQTVSLDALESFSNVHQFKHERVHFEFESDINNIHRELDILMSLLEERIEDIDIERITYMAGAAWETALKLKATFGRVHEEQTTGQS